jgi:hypothetical protein
MDFEEDNSNEDDDLDDLLDKTWEMQDQIHKKCKMKDKNKKVK